MKRARSVAIFSLKLKERRAREAQEKASKNPLTPTNTLPPPQQGGELACIPIEKASIVALVSKISYSIIYIYYFLLK